MKSGFFKILARALKLLAALTVAKYRPGVIGVTGSVGKTSTKEAIRSVLRGVREVRESRGNFNSEIGLPLTIIGSWKDEELKLFSREHPSGANRARKIWFLFKVITVGIFRLVFGRRRYYPELLLLEFGADKPGDIKYLLQIVRPQIAVITAVGEVPVHVEFYSSPEQVAREKSRLVEQLPSNGFAILNADDENVLSMKERTRAHVITFGFSDDAEVRITNFEHRIENGKPTGIAFKLHYGGSFVPMRMENCFGKPAAMAAAAAAAAGIVFGMHLVRIAEALAAYQPPPHRARLLSGVRGSLVLDDSYNASPLSMAAAIDIAKSLPAARRVGVLGDMLELGEYSLEAHERIGKLAAKVFDVLVTVGTRGKLIADSAREAGMSRRGIFSFDSVDEAIPKLDGLIRKGDLVLIKASWAIHLDRIVHSIKQL